MKNTWALKNLKQAELSALQQDSFKKKNLHDLANLLVESIFVSIIITMVAWVIRVQ